MFVAVFVNMSVAVANFEINLIFLINPIFLHAQKVKTKKLNFLRTKRAFNVNKKFFSLFLKGYH